MANIETIERMLSEVQAGARASYLSDSYKNLNRTQAIECHFKFEPRLRYMRYITSFNRILDDYTNFRFDVVSIKSGCIDVTYFAQDFDQFEKNTVRRQVLRLLRERNLQEEFCIATCVVFEKHRYVCNESARYKEED